MNILPIHTGKLAATDSLTSALMSAATFVDGDIIAISSKIVAYTEGAAIDLRTITPTAEAIQWTETLTHSSKHPPFRQAVLNETVRMNGRVLYGSPFAMFCELRPAGLTQGVVLAVNAGLDLSNVDDGFAIGWPVDPVTSVQTLHEDLERQSGKNLGVIITDSCCLPRRWGVVATALTVAGFDPLKNEIGRTDLWGDALTMTQEAQADQLAIAANFIMGNADQAIPAAIIRGSGIPLTNFIGWVPGIEPSNDMFQGIV